MNTQHHKATGEDEEAEASQEGGAGQSDGPQPSSPLTPQPPSCPSLEEEKETIKIPKIETSKPEHEVEETLNFKDAVGRTFVFPFHLVKTWPVRQSIISFSPDFFGCLVPLTSLGALCIFRA